jgi:AraC-like DNA-binding protein
VESVYAVGLRLDVTTDDTTVIVPVCGAARVRQGDTEVTVSPQLGAAIVSAGARAIEFPDEGVVAQIHFTGGVLESALTLLCDGSVDGSIRFSPAVPRDGAGLAPVEQLGRLLIDEIDARSCVTVLDPAVAGLIRGLARALLVHHPHSHAHLLELCSRPCEAGAVARAHAYIEAHAAEPLYLADLARAAGTCVRTLQRAFRAHSGQSPMQFIHEVRMAMARRKLLDPFEGTTVSSIARSCGFLHMGRFSVDYRRRFGEPPTETLRRAWVRAIDAGLVDAGMAVRRGRMRTAA